MEKEFDDKFKARGRIDHVGKVDLNFKSKFHKHAEWEMWTGFNLQNWLGCKEDKVYSGIGVKLEF